MGVHLVSLMDQLAKIESTMMSFPAGGSIYYARSRDLEELSVNEGIMLEHEIESISLSSVGW